MKLPLLGLIAAMIVTAAGTTFAAESNTNDSASGASDSTVMSQEKKTKTEKKVHKQNQPDEAKRGRPSNQQSR